MFRCAHTIYGRFLRLLCNWRTHIVCACLPACLPAYTLYNRLLHTMQHQLYTHSTITAKEMKLIKQYKSSEISTVIFYEANYLRDNWFDVCLCATDFGIVHSFALTDWLIGCTNWWYVAIFWFQSHWCQCDWISMPETTKQYTLEKHWAGLKTKVKTIDKLGEKITINTDRLYLLSLILCTLLLLLRNKPYGILNMNIEKICMSFVINSKAPFTNIMRKICESTWK